MNDLERDLIELGHALDFGDIEDVGSTSLVEAVLGRLDAPARARFHDRVSVRVAAAVLLVAGALTASLPGPRGAVAGWLGFDSVRIERVPELDVDVDVEPELTQLPGPGDSSVVVVGGREVLISAIDGRLTEPFLSKTVGAGTEVVEVSVGGEPGLWIGGRPHEVLYETDDGAVVDRVSGNTLLWQVDAVLYRVEGFDTLDDAIAFALGTT